MSQEEIRRRKTTDPEMDAMNVVAQALGPLDRSAAQRVVEWAKKRYCEVHLPGLDLADMTAVNKFMTAAAQTASRLNLASAEELLHAMAKVAEELPSEDEHVPQ